ncbi:hypothetical protein NLJ89_g676 [Agrocybe chaxingu]|uniref:Transcription factor spt8 beta-propeller domain-containing protein n=1 Tax=Agrocybe chaxingu TaxID=84603 RepID=A0A9W8TFQ7_9AGAR|nr:hypothetical protein NLJ89_g676 [Agrocybe chaxingu]
MIEEQYDSEEETLEDLYEGEDDAEMYDEPGETLPGMTLGADDATEDGDDDSGSDDSESDEDEDEEDEDEEPLDLGLIDELDQPPPQPPANEHLKAAKTDARSPSLPPPAPPSPPRIRELTPAQLRRKALTFTLDKAPRSFVIEAICAIPHPGPTNALASSACMTHLLTGSDDGYIRNYDIFAAVNSKNFLTAPQRQHAGVVEGLMKSGQLRFWWENPVPVQEPRPAGVLAADDEPRSAPIYSLAMQSDALWTLAGTDAGNINLFTVRHDPGRLIHIMNGHRGPISALALDYDEKGFFSAGWDGEAIQWDLHTGQGVRNYTAHNTHLTSIAVRPLSSGYAPTSAPVYTRTDQGAVTTEQKPLIKDSMDIDVDSKLGTNNASNRGQLPDLSQAIPMDSDARSDASFDPLFDDVPEEPAKPVVETKLAMPGTAQARQPTGPPPQSTIPPPKGAPPLFDPVEYATYSSELLMTSYIDGQVVLWDRRVQTAGKGVGRLWMSEKTPPWCLSACWSADGAYIYAGRRNGTVDAWDVRVLGASGPMNTPRVFKSLRNPTSSGVVSASVDNIRLWNVADAGEDIFGKSRSGVQFKIIPGHHGGYISQMLIDAGARFLVSASSNRGWHGDSTRTVFVHDIKYLL